MKKISVYALVFLLSACALQTPYQKPQINTPAAWAQPSETNAAPVSSEWWKNFKNKELEKLIATALAQNNDIRASISRIQQARADLKIAGASLLPSIDLSSGADISHENPATGKTNTSKNLTAGLAIAYELDLFGGNRAAQNAAQANLDASNHDADALALVTMADTAKSFFTILGLRDRKAITAENLRNAESVLKIIEARFNAGSATAIDVSRQKTALYTSSASLQALAEQETKEINALSVLLGQSPQTVSISTQSLFDLSVPSIATAQPSDLLERRPDISAAEDNLKAANANIAVARAALYPSVSLDSGLNLIKSPIGDPVSKTLSLATSLAAPIFNNGRLEGSVEKATAQQTELIETYRKTILTSFQETEDAMAGLASASNRVSALETAAIEAERAYDLTRKLFDAGSIDLENVINVENSLLSTKDTLSQARLARLNASIDLYKALGGGWQKP